MLHVDQVTKVYKPPPPLLRPFVRTAVKKSVLALADVSFRVEAGGIVGLVGPNGAGKTTLIRIITTLLEPTSGTVTLDDLHVDRDGHEFRRRIGLVLSDDRGLYWRLTGRQNLHFFGVMAGLKRAEAVRRTTELMQEVGLAGRDKLVFGYSAGMRTRLSLARALLIDPPLLVLDEPTRSLDPVATREVGDMLRRLAARGHAVLLSSHRLDEVADVCTKVVALVGGTIRFEGAPAELAADRAGSMEALVRLLTQDTEPA